MVDIAVGDVDKLVDDSGYYHDEIAVRQILLVWDNSSAGLGSPGSVGITVFAVDPQYHFVVINRTEDYTSPGGPVFGDYVEDLHTAAGNFVGHGVKGTATSPVMQMEIFYHSHARDPYGFQWRVLAMSSTGDLPDRGSAPVGRGPLVRYYRPSFKEPLKSSMVLADLGMDLVYVPSRYVSPNTSWRFHAVLSCRPGLALVG